MLTMNHESTKLFVNVQPGTDFNDLPVDTVPAESTRDNVRNLPSVNAIRATWQQASAEVMRNAMRDIVSRPAIITRDGIDIFRPGTLAMIQGRHGSHKSRLAEMFCSLLLADNPRSENYAGFERYALQRFRVVYVDTERNTIDEFPRSIQSIKRLAGFSENSDVDRFHAVPLKNVPRKDRLSAVQDVLKFYRETSQEHLVLVLDVATDCVGNFNNESEALALFDFLGQQCEASDATILMIIHENPGSDKARGHVGTEAWNKAATAIQIGYQGENADILRLRYIKLRHAKRPADIYLTYDQERRGLMQTTAGESDKSKYSLDEFIDAIVNAFDGKEALTKPELFTRLQEKTGYKKDTLEVKISDIINSRIELTDYTRDWTECHLEKENTRPITYRLTPAKAPF
jgi:hypothetical protein